MAGRPSKRQNVDNGKLSPSNAALLPIYLDNQNQMRGLYAVPILWPADGNAKKAADAHFRPGGPKDINTQHAAAAVRQLTECSELYKDTLYRSPTSRMVSLNYAVMIQEDPPIVVLDREVKWDLNTPDAMLALYAARIASDLGLDQRAACRIEEELHSTVIQIRKQVVAGSHALIARPGEGDLIRKEVAKYPMLMTGESAEKFLEIAAATKKKEGVGRKEGGGGGATATKGKK